MIKKHRELSKYSTFLTSNGTRRFYAALINALLLIVVMFGASVLCNLILSNIDSYSTEIELTNQNRIACYKISEESKIYTFKENDDGQYDNLVAMDRLFEEYALSHILLSYEKYPEIFDIYKIQVENSLDVEVASYTSDQLAYFYTEYATKYDVVDFNGDDPRLYFIKRIKDTSPKTDYWVFDERGLEMPVLKGEFAVDLYRYLFGGEEDYQTGLTNYNYLATGFNQLWQQQAGELKNSERYRAVHDKYMEHYANCSYVLDIAHIIAYIVSFAIVMLLPVLITKRRETIGNIVMKITTIRSDGYEMLTSDKLLRSSIELFLFLPVVAVSTFFSGGLYSGLYYPVIVIGEIGISFINICLFFLIFVFINIVMSGIKEKRTITDLLSHTRVCDLRFDSLVKESDSKSEGEGELEKLRHQYNSSDGSLYFDSTCFNNTERK